MADNGVTFRLPDVPQLKGEENLDYWDLMLKTNLACQDLDKYLESNIPMPEAEAVRKKWKSDRLKIKIIIVASLQTPGVLTVLENSGWSRKEEDPKVTYDAIMKEIPRLSTDNTLSVIQSFCRIDCGKFESFTKFLDTLTDLKKKLEKQDCDMGKNTMMLIAIGAVKEHFETKAEIWLRDQTAGTLTWELLMRDFSGIAMSERTLPFSFYSNNNKPQGGDRHPTEGRKINCSTCGGSAKIWTNQRHCKICNHHVKKDSPICFWCNPEQAPNNWKNKKAALDARATAGGATTSALRQQSGVASPSALALSNGGFLFRGSTEPSFQ